MVATSMGAFWCLDSLAIYSGVVWQLFFSSGKSGFKKIKEPPNQFELKNELPWKNGTEQNPHLILGSPKTFAKISKEACTPGPLGLFVTLLHGPPYHTSCKLTFLGNIKFDSKLLIQFLASMCVYIYILNSIAFLLIVCKATTVGRAAVQLEQQDVGYIHVSGDLTSRKNIKNLRIIIIITIGPDPQI